MTNAAANRRTERKMEVNQAVMETKLDKLTEEVRRHNNFAQRMPVVEEKMAVANHRIADLEHQVEQIRSENHE